jgi:hypothetical protein
LNISENKSSTATAPMWPALKRNKAEDRQGDDFSAATPIRL